MPEKAANKSLFKLTNDAIKSIERIVASGSKAEVEYGRDGIKISAIQRKTAYKNNESHL